ncbi:MAG TPA: phytanoyl-CoA dioxygenase family protein [Candidatus Elarobacter sp.]
MRPWFERDDWEALADEKGLDRRERARVDAYRRDGFLLFEDDRILDGIDADGIWERLRPRFAGGDGVRVQDAWETEESVRAIALQPQIIATLRMLYGREPIPFQTLNFLTGTEQRTHSDVIHFSSLPAGFMCGVWVALEDITLRQGPLHYFRGSQRLPELDYEDLGIAPVRGVPMWSNPNTLAAYQAYEEKIAALAAESGFAREDVAIRRGSWLIWSANLLHGGTPRDDRTLTRRSQVTHYYFENAIPYTPMFSRRSDDAFFVRALRSVRDGKLLPPPTLDGARVLFPRVKDEPHLRSIRPAAALPPYARWSLGGGALPQPGFSVLRNRAGSIAQRLGIRP